MSTEAIRAVPRRLRKVRLVGIAVVFAAFSFPGATVVSAGADGSPKPLVIRLFIDSHVYSPGTLPPKYEGYVKAARDEDRVEHGVYCGKRYHAASGSGSAGYCVETFYPRYPYHRLPAVVRNKLVNSIRRMGGELVDWAFTDGYFVGLAIDETESFFMVRVDEHGEREETLGRFLAANSDVQSMMDDPHPFCFDFKEEPAVPLAVEAAKSYARLVTAWRCAALMVCGANGEETPFFIFPEQKVHEWWAKPWVIAGRGTINGSRHLLCNIVWEVLNSKSGSSRVTIPAMDPEDPNGGRIGQLVTLDFGTGRFLIRGKQIYPESPQGVLRKNSIRGVVELPRFCG